MAKPALGLLISADGPKPPGGMGEPDGDEADDGKLMAARALRKAISGGDDEGVATAFQTLYDHCQPAMEEENAEEPEVPEGF